MNKRPQDDMYCYVNNKWEKSIKIPKAYSKWSIFQELHEKKLKNLRYILKNLDEKNKNDKLLSIFQMQYLEKNKKSLKPYHFYINLINYTFTKKELVSKMGFLNQYGISNLLGLGITPDFKNSKYNILGIYPTILSLPDRDYYLNPKKKKYLTRLKKFIEDLLKIPD